MDKHTYFYHSPRVEGEKRHTVAGVLKNGVLNFGVASCSKGDNFVKSFGRGLSLERANTKPSNHLNVGKNHNVGKCFTLVARGIIQSLQL